MLAPRLVVYEQIIALTFMPHEGISDKTSTETAASS